MSGLENFLMFILQIGQQIIGGMVFLTIEIISEATGMFLTQYDIKLVLFSDTPIFETNLQYLLTIFFGIFYTVIFITIIYKIIKKVFVKITGWNKW